MRLVFDRKKFDCLFPLMMLQTSNHAASSQEDITIGNDNTPASSNLKTRRRKRSHQAAGSHGPKPLTKEVAEEVSQVDKSWLKDVASRNI